MKPSVERAECPLLCGWVATVYPGDAEHVNCDHCGEFKIARTLLAGLGNEEAKGLLPYLSAHTRQANQRGEVVTLNTKNWRDFALAHKNTPFPQNFSTFCSSSVEIQILVARY